MTDTPKKKLAKKPTQSRRSLTMPRSFLTGSQIMPEPRKVRRDDKAL